MTNLIFNTFSPRKAACHYVINVVCFLLSCRHCQ